MATNYTTDFDLISEGSTPLAGSGLASGVERVRLPCLSGTSEDSLVKAPEVRTPRPRTGSRHRPVPVTITPVLAESRS
jgi:hypothetical protein